MRGPISICLLLLLIAGCDTLGGRTVVLNLQPSGKQSADRLSKPVEVQQALEFIDTIMTNEVIRRVAANPSEEPRIAHYVGGPFICTVAQVDDQLRVDFRNTGFAAGRHPTGPVEEKSEQLAEKLKTQYGAKQVRIEH
jgi:hypothetical protein